MFSYKSLHSFKSVTVYALKNKCLQSMLYWSRQKEIN